RSAPARWRWETPSRAWSSRADGAALRRSPAAAAAPPRPGRLATVAAAERGLAAAVGGDLAGRNGAAGLVHRVRAAAEPGSPAGHGVCVRGGVPRRAGGPGQRGRGEPRVAAVRLDRLLDLRARGGPGD